MKIPIIRKGEYDIWSMRMRQYICHTDHNLWDVIVNGDLEEEPAPTGETSAPLAPKTAKQLAAKRNQERVKSILLLAIPDEYLLKYQAEVPKKSFLFSWNQIALIMKNKPDVDEIDIDDLYNNLRVYEDEMKRLMKMIGRLDPYMAVGYVDCQSEEISFTEDRRTLIQRKMNHVSLDKSNLSATNKAMAPKQLNLHHRPLEAQNMARGYDWSNDFEVEPVNYALMAISSSRLDQVLLTMEISLSVFYVRSSDEENTPANDRFSKADGFHVVPPPITGSSNPRADIVG
ncbi:hypothetical protein Tco_1164694 [Tanacetum coccineum]